mgnify:FL=1
MYFITAEAAEDALENPLRSQGTLRFMKRNWVNYIICANLWAKINQPR